MAATGTPTPNIGLRRPQGTDPASVDDINYNSNLIDTKLGAVGNTSVQEQINSLNSKIETKQVSTGINDVTAYKTGNAIFLHVVATMPTAKGWYEIGTLPAELRPVHSFYSTIELVNTDNTTAQLQIISSSGKLQVYNPNTTSNSANGMIMYVVP